MLHILICDDDSNFAELLSKKIATLPDYSPRAMHIRCLSKTDEILREDFSSCDILFLDIDMGEVNGIDLARKMRRTRPDIVLLFVTNFLEFAPEGYEVNAFRYLAKAKLAHRLPQYFADALAISHERQSEVDIVCIGEPVSIAVQSIVYIESVGHEQCIHLCNASKEPLLTRMTMAELEKVLSPHGFLRIHRSFLVNMAYLRQLRSTGAELTIGETLPVGARSYRETKGKFVSWMVQHL